VDPTYLRPILDALNENAGAVTAASTAIYSLLTLVVIWQARAERRSHLEADVRAFPRPHRG
jgi:hypothetical protein